MSPKHIHGNFAVEVSHVCDENAMSNIMLCGYADSERPVKRFPIAPTET